MNEKDSTTVGELIPLVFQLRELVLTGPEDVVHLHRTQSSCGGEDAYETPQ